MKAASSFNAPGGRRIFRSDFFKILRCDFSAVANISAADIPRYNNQVEQAIIHHYSYALGQLAEICTATEQRQQLTPLKLFGKQA